MVQAWNLGQRNDLNIGSVEASLILESTEVSIIIEPAWEDLQPVSTGASLKPESTRGNLALRKPWFLDPWDRPESTEGGLGLRYMESSLKPGSVEAVRTLSLFE